MSDFEVNTVLGLPVFFFIVVSVVISNIPGDQKILFQCICTIQRFQVESKTAIK